MPAVLLFAGSRLPHSALLALKSFPFSVNVMRLSGRKLTNDFPLLSYFPFLYSPTAPLPFSTREALRPDVSSY